MPAPLTLGDVQRALALPDFDTARAHRLMSPVTRAISRPPQLGGEARLGGIMMLLFAEQGELQLVLTRRRPDLAAHPGQISFPGGRHEPPETMAQTALRETEEEIGMPAQEIEILGGLTPIYIPPSDFQVYPFVGWVTKGERPLFSPEPAEVAEIIEAPLDPLLQPGMRVEEWWDLGGQRLLVPYFAVGEHKVWGGTAIMLSEFVERLRAVTDHQS